MFRLGALSGGTKYRAYENVERICIFVISSILLHRLCPDGGESTHALAYWDWIIVSQFIDQYSD